MDEIYGERTVGEIYGVENIKDIDKRMTTNSRGLIHFQHLYDLGDLVQERGHTHLRLAIDTAKLIKNPITE